MRPVIPFALLLSACAARPVHTVVLPVKSASVREAAVEVVNATGRELPAPRCGLFDSIARLRGDGAAEASTADVFAAAAAEALRTKGIPVVGGERRAGLALLRVTLLDFEIRDPGTASAVAFLSARFRLVDAEDVPLFEATERGVAIRLGGPDLTWPEMARIAREAVRDGLARLPPSSPS